MTSGVDAFAQTDWEEHNNYCNPPWDLLPQLVRFLGSLQRVRATVVAPLWTGSGWYQSLVDMAADVYVIPQGCKVFCSTMEGTSVPKLTTRWPTVVVSIRR